MNGIRAAVLNPTALVIALLMFSASGAAVLVRPTAKAGGESPNFLLELTVPKRFGDWEVEPQRVVQVVNPQTQALLDKLYAEVLTRTYVNSAGYRVMLSVAYGSDQRGSLQAHKPEVCYPAQGFKLHRSETGALPTSFGEIPVRRLYTTLGSRSEPVTYWFVVGDRAVRSKLEKRLVDLRMGLTGRIPDGLLFRVSSIDADTARAYRVQDQFVQELLQSVPPETRRRLSGLADS